MLGISIIARFFYPWDLKLVAITEEIVFCIEKLSSDRETVARVNNLVNRKHYLIKKQKDGATSIKYIEPNPNIYQLKLLRPFINLD